MWYKCGINLINADDSLFFFPLGLHRPETMRTWLRGSVRTYENVVPSEDPGMVADAARMSFAKEAPIRMAHWIGFVGENLVFTIKLVGLSG